MNYLSPIAAAALLLATAANPAVTNRATISACRVAATPAAWVGKEVRIEGYIVNLSSRGFVLVAARGCRAGSLLGLQVNKVRHTAIWRNADFGTVSGPKRAVLVGKVRWRQPPLRGRADVEIIRLDSLSKRDARWEELS